MYPLQLCHGQVILFQKLWLYPNLYIFIFDQMEVFFSFALEELAVCRARTHVRVLALFEIVVSIY